MHYVLKSNDDANFLAVLMPNSSTANKKNNLKLLNDQLKIETGLTLFEKYINVSINDILIEKQHSKSFLHVLIHLLVEMKLIQDIENDTNVNVMSLLQIAENNRFIEETLSLHEIQTEKVAEIDSKFRNQSIMFNLISLILVYCTTLDPNFNSLKERFVSWEPQFQFHL